MFLFCFLSCLFLLMFLLSSFCSVQFSVFWFSSVQDFQFSAFSCPSSLSVLSSFQFQCFCTVTTVERWALSRLCWFLPNVGRILTEDNFLSPTWVLMCWMQVFIARPMANGGAERGGGRWTPEHCCSQQPMQCNSYHICTTICRTVLQYIKLLFPWTITMQYTTQCIYWDKIQQCIAIHKNGTHCSVVS